jgi:hypothetical protein
MTISFLTHSLFDKAVFGQEANINTGKSTEPPDLALYVLKLKISWK